MYPQENLRKYFKHISAEDWLKNFRTNQIIYFHETGDIFESRNSKTQYGKACAILKIHQNYLEVKPISGELYERKVFNIGHHHFIGGHVGSTDRHLVSIRIDYQTDKIQDQISNLGVMNDKLMLFQGLMYAKRIMHDKIKISSKKVKKGVYVIRPQRTRKKVQKVSRQSRTR